jgi:hypothetical protein
MRKILYSLITFVTFTPVVAFAQQNLVNLPIGETGDFNDYINAVYVMFISIAALIAVIKIIIAGVKYMFSDIVTQKSEAKRDIQGALLGLLVVMAAVVVLTIINPDLTTFNPEISRVQERQILTATPGTARRVTCSGNGVQCIAYTCTSPDCSTEETNCRAKNGVPTSQGGTTICATSDSTIITENSLPSREIACSGTSVTTEICRAEREQCTSGDYFNGRPGRVEDTSEPTELNGIFTSDFVCQAVMTESEREGQQDVSVDRAIADANLRRCEDPNSTTRQYWWDADNNRCRLNSFAEETVQEQIPPSIAVAQDTSWLPFTELRVLELDNPDDYPGITRLCRQEYGLTQNAETLQTNGVEYNPTTQLCAVTYIRVTPTQELAPVTEQPAEYRSEFFESQGN